MIFGFNTDVKQADTVYHVQSEVRQAECLLQTQVFVRGRCIGKLATAIEESAPAPVDSDTFLHERLKAQHRHVLEAIRAGQVDALFPVVECAAINASGVTDDIAPVELTLEWLESETRSPEEVVVLRFGVRRSEQPAVGAQIIARLDVPGHEALFIDVEAAANGVAEVAIPLDRAVPEATVAIQATHAAHTVRRRFRVHRK